MTNAAKFNEVFRLFASEIWAMREPDFLLWLKEEYSGKERKTGKWIPVKERLPEKSGTYLVYVRDEHIDRTNEYMSVVYFSKFTGEFSTASKWHKVLAWIPSPEPYKEVDG